MVFYACVLCLCILASLRIPLIDFEATNPSFVRWFYHSYRLPRYRLGRPHLDCRPTLSYAADPRQVTTIAPVNGGCQVV
jgi:hypothetical protein